MAIAEIGDTNPQGTVQIIDTNWDSNGTLRVTVREMIGEIKPPDTRLKQARRLARRALAHPRLTKSSRVTRTFYVDNSTHWTFAVSRH